MPHRLKERQKKIQDKRKQTPWREFVIEVASWMPFNLYRTDSGISRYPLTDRVSKLIPSVDFDLQLEQQDFSVGNIFDSYTTLLNSAGFPLLNDFGGNENADFADGSWNSKSIYLAFTVIKNNENIAYSFHVKDGSKDVLNSVNVVGGSSVVYGSRSIVDSYNVFFGEKIINSNNIRCSINLVGCSECILCNGLENQSYCIKNKQYSKEEYFVKKHQLLSQKDKLKKFDSKTPFVVNSKNADGDFLVNCFNVQKGFDCQNLTNGRNLSFIASKEDNTDFYDVISAGRSSSFYAVSNSGSYSDRVYCSTEIITCNNIYYSMFLESCSYCLGCIGLKNKSYCIFNKQYTKEERYDKVDEIFSQMEKDGDIGKFFPGSMNPFYFNDTAAYLIDDTFTKEEVEAKGYMRRDEPIQVDIPAGAKVVKTTDLDQYEGRKDSSTSSEGQEWHIDPEILKVIIQDEQGNVYRIVQMEYDFLIKHRLPLPRKHWLERMKENFRVG